MSDPEDPARSYILFAPAKASEAYDYLFLKEVAALDLRDVDLVTISACDSAHGKLIEGEGAQSFDAAFLGAGAKTVVASLWPVGDRATARFMHDFYDALAHGSTATASLRAAKQNTMKEGHTHPFYWAGFILSGDGEVRIPHVISAWITAGATLGLIGTVLVALSIRTAAVTAARSRRSH
jgi:CHAT domain-containing protein